MAGTIRGYQQLASIDAEVIADGRYSDAIHRYRQLLDSLPLDLQDEVNDRLKGLTARNDQADRTGSDPLVMTAQRNERIALANMEGALQAMRKRLAAVEDSIAHELDRLSSALNAKQKEVDRMSRIQVISFTGPKGSKVHYLGEVAEGKANGGGVGIWSTGSVYRGQWRNNLRHGEGTFEWADGERYEGTYVNGVRTGTGTYFWPSGERYEGQWREDRRNGPGTLFDMDGNIRFKGNWKDDKPVERAGDTQ